MNLEFFEMLNLPFILIFPGFKLLSWEVCFRRINIQTCLLVLSESLDQRIETERIPSRPPFLRTVSSCFLYCQALQRLFLFYSFILLLLKESFSFLGFKSNFIKNLSKSESIYRKIAIWFACNLLLSVNDRHKVLQYSKYCFFSVNVINHTLSFNRVAKRDDFCVERVWNP